MSAYAHSTPSAPALRVSLESVRLALLWLTSFSGAFVFIEPSPYELVTFATVIVFAITGLALRPAHLPLAFLLIVYIIGLAISVIPILGEPKAAQWVLISIFLCVTAVFFAAMLDQNTERRLQFLLNGYTAAAVVASFAAIAGYFRLVPQAEMFLRYERAQGTFNDPNVLGAFLVLPALLALQRVLGGRLREIIRGGALLLLFVIALLLSFSRAAWGQFAASAALLLFLTFVTTHSSRERMRIVGLGMAGVLVLIGFVIALLSIDQVADLFKERASLDQSYDTGHSGRFGRHVLGFQLALERPWGIGPLQFAKIFPEDPHNVYLNSFMAGGWLGGLSYLALVVILLCIGLRCVFHAAPWRSRAIAVYAAFFGVAAESIIIDSDHWRHYFLLVGVMWGLAAVSMRHRKAVWPQTPTLPRRVSPSAS